MIIDRVEAVPYRIPMRKPLRFASGEVLELEHVLLRIGTAEGIVGVADIPPRPYTYGETQASVAAVIETVFAPALIGSNPLDRGQIHARLHRTVGNVAAKGGVDIALWDLIGTSLGQPVHRLLGGHSDSLRVSHMVGFASGPEMVAEAIEHRDRYGIEVFKVKVGRRPLRLDIDACRALREALGPDVELYLDANRGWTAVEAMEVLDATADLGITFFEEPCDAAEVLGRRRLVTHSRIPIVADESVPTLGDAARELMTGGASALSIKTARTGFTQSQQILALAEGLGIEVIMGNQIDTQIGSTATVAFGAAFSHSSRRAAELSNFLDMADDLIAEPLRISGGRVEAPSVPGVGAGIDEDKLAFYRLDARVA
ncbi:mandelate racemase/muconate lactonizing enzyme family protein [Microbacterium sp. SSM24]|uniref:mandelate racemase/muconate lactonizing enzyme family protein n=1 Tax=Microbacterium sp. SSM24 TaxID=2991714 RepID=UPI0022271490|nr:enolase C-terminal domain-like protein [Microbacterium sp. SSM24]MCW3492654.1 enolase [Microbacterium sp. SSM24]